MEPGQSQFHEDYTEQYELYIDGQFKCIGTKFLCESIVLQHPKLEFVYELRKWKPFRYRIVWSREFLEPDKIKGYYVIETKVLDNWKPEYIYNGDGKIVGGAVSPFVGLRLFEL